MQKVIRRTTLAKNQAARKARIQLKKDKRLDFIENLRERDSLERTKADNLRAERIRRREDWMKGPLAPNRDSGLDAGTYGTISPQETQLPTIPTRLRRRFVNFAPGDRVCLLKGPDAGKICEVASVSVERESITLKDEHQADVRYPSWIRQANPDMAAYVTNSMPLSIDDVRLVCTLEEDGRQYEVIAKHVHGGGPYLQRQNDETPRHTRYITGENIPIPWPNESLTKPAVDEDGDTSRKEVEHETFEPTLWEPPFASTIIDELRNKYSKYRTRHDPNWVANRKLDDLREEYLKSRTMLTPFGELKAKEAQEKEAIRRSKLDKNGNYIMDASTAAFIAQFIEKKNPAGRQPQ